LYRISPLRIYQCAIGGRRVYAKLRPRLQHRGREPPMLKPVLILCGVMIAIAMVAPEYFSRIGSNADQRAAAAQTGAVPEPVATSTDHGGLVRLAADPRGHYVTEIEVNNRPLKALVDTGATVVALRYEDARALGLIFPGDKFDVTVRTANGEGRARMVKLRSVNVGTITIRDVEALVVQEGALGANLLGMSFLKRLSRFEVQRGQLVLER
jgi:aspartyl protease family protein